MGRNVQSFEIPTAGAAGAATGQKKHYAGQGQRLAAVVLKYTNQPATVDVTITNEGRAILTRSNANTNTVIYPRHLVQDAAGVDTTVREAPILLGEITIDVAQGNADAAGVTVTLVYE